MRPYFEVLVVETLTAAQEQALREEALPGMYRWRGRWATRARTGWG